MNQQGKIRHTKQQSRPDAPLVMPPQKKASFAKKAASVFWTLAFLVLVLFVIGAGVLAFMFVKQRATPVVNTNAGQKTQILGTTTNKNPSDHGVVTGSEAPITYSSQQVGALIRETNANYKGPQPNVTMQVFKYRIQDAKGTTEEIYARVFMPEGAATNSKLPILSFAPGTTGIDDSCAASLEVPSKRNWANYASHMASYAANGYVAVITDYEGMRDPKRVHHYMVGDLEGRSVLDAALAMTTLPLTKDKADASNVFVAGYSQGGHAALWADQLANSYTPSITLRGVIGFGPVTDVRETLTDTTRGANILWFGPYLLRSYQDWYGTEHNVAQILQQPYSGNLVNDVAKNCIDTNIGYWGNRDITKVYTPEFIAAMKTGSLQTIAPAFDQQLLQNRAATTKTGRPKLINHGRLDNVVLPTQSDTTAKRLCSLGEVTSLKLYPDATHYNTMIKSFQDTLNWMRTIISGSSAPSTCS